MVQRVVIRETANQRPIAAQPDQRPGSGPVFYFDGDFRSWAQLNQRLGVNTALTVGLAGMAAFAPPTSRP